MSEAYVPIVLHNNLNHKYYYRACDINGTYTSTCYWSGIYPRVHREKEIAYTELSDKLLCYDTCCVNVNDYLYLVDVLGINMVNSLISEDALKIIDDNDIKMAIFNIQPNGSRIISFTSNNIKDPEFRINEYNRIYGSQIEQSNYPQVIRNILSSVRLENQEEMFNSLNEEIKKDFLNPNIMNNLGLINGGIIVDRDDDYNQYMYNRLAYLNLYLYMMSNLGFNNIVIPPEIQTLLDVKTGAYINSNFQRQLTAFSSICEINKVADIPKALQDKALDYNDILRIRSDKHAIEFRKWLSKACSNNAPFTYKEVQDIAELYNAACTEKSKFELIWNKDYIKVLKFVIPTVIGSIPDPIAMGSGAAVGLSIFSIDTIMSKKFRPSMFIDGCLKKYVDEKLLAMKKAQENAYFIQQLGKIDRNDLCPCGSKLKYKKCHGN